MGAEQIDLQEDARRFRNDCYLLDTCTLLWMTNEPERLSHAATSLWRDPEQMIAVSVINYWEIAIKKEKLGIHNVAWFWEHRVLPYVDLEPIQMRESHITDPLLLPQLHKDPFDRMLVAQARVENMILITPDESIRAYDVQTVW